MILVFFLTFFLALGLTFSLLLTGSRRGFLIALGVILTLFLKWQQLAHFLNIILLTAVIFSVEAYLSKLSRP